MICHIMTQFEGRDAIQKGFDRLERWTHVNFMKINKAKCKEESQTQVEAVQRMDWEQPWEEGLGVVIEWETQHDPAMWTPSPES